jgi:hypothetical protein
MKKLYLGILLARVLEKKILNVIKKPMKGDSVIGV